MIILPITPALLVRRLVKYLIIANIAWAALASPSGGRSIRLALNGGYGGKGQESSGLIANWQWEMVATMILSLSVNDYVEVTVYHTQGTAINIHSDSAFGMHRIG